MIVVKKYPTKKHKVYKHRYILISAEPFTKKDKKEDIFIGKVNECELLDIQCQIKESKGTEKNYYVVYNGQKLPISINGRIKAPKGFIDTMDDLQKRLMGF